MISNVVNMPVTVDYDFNTDNESFLKMHYFLKAKGIQNNKFFLLIYDSGLKGIDPRNPAPNNPMLARQLKLRILRECTINFW